MTRLLSCLALIWALAGPAAAAPPRAVTSPVELAGAAFAGRTLVVAQRSGAVFAVDLAAGRARRVAEFAGPVLDLAPVDGHSVLVLAAAGSGRRAVLLGTGSGEAEVVVGSLPGWVEAVALGPDGPVVAGARGIAAAGPEGLRSLSARPAGDLAVSGGRVVAAGPRGAFVVGGDELDPAASLVAAGGGGEVVLWVRGRLEAATVGAGPAGQSGPAGQVEGAVALAGGPAGVAVVRARDVVLVGRGAAETVRLPAPRGSSPLDNPLVFALMTAALLVALAWRRGLLSPRPRSRPPVPPGF